MEKGHIPKIVHSAFKREVGFIHCGNPWTNFTAAKYLLFSLCSCLRLTYRVQFWIFLNIKS